jgi:hypothetical protein
VTVKEGRVAGDQLLNLNAEPSVKIRALTTNPARVNLPTGVDRMVLGTLS